MEIDERVLGKRILWKYSFGTFVFEGRVTEISNTKEYIKIPPFGWLGSIREIVILEVLPPTRMDRLINVLWFKKRKGKKRK